MTGAAVDAAPAPAPSRDVAVIAIVGVVHSTSHLFQFALPPMFPLLQAEFGASYAELALVLSTFYLASGIGQAFVGILVDRHGGRVVLAWGTTLLSMGVGGMAFVQELWMLYPLAFFAGAGNSVYHPADFAILSARVSPRLTGRAFGIHAFGGTLGYAVSPILLSLLGYSLGWRTALILALFYGLAQAAIVWRAKDLLGGGPISAATAKEGPRDIARGFVKLLTMSALVAAFVYLTMTSIAGGAIQAFGAASLSALHAVDYQSATVAVTLFLTGQAAGILVGGVLADRTDRHGFVAAAGLVGCAAFVLGALYPAGDFWAPKLCFMLAGACVGVTAASRDLLVKKLSPPGATGRTFGLVYSGFDIGFLLGPLVAGMLLDRGRPDLALIGVAAIFALTLIAIRSVEGFGRANQAAKAVPAAR